jgi:hypothetical protein
MEISAQNAAAQTVNPYDADKVVEKRETEKNAIKVQDTKEDDKIEERKTSSEIETKREDAAPSRSETESIDEAYAKDKEAEALSKISVYA